MPRKVYTRDLITNSRGESYSVIKTSDIIDLREQVYDFPEQSVITKDNVTTRINALLYFQITDPFKSVYEIENLPNAIEKLTQTTLRNIIGELELDETLTSRDTINSKLREVLDEATNNGASKSTEWNFKTSLLRKAYAMPWNNRCRLNARDVPRYSRLKAKRLP